MLIRTRTTVNDQYICFSAVDDLQEFVFTALGLGETKQDKVANILNKVYNQYNTVLQQYLVEQCIHDTISNILDSCTDDELSNGTHFITVGDGAQLEYNISNEDDTKWVMCQLNVHGYPIGEAFEYPAPSQLIINNRELMLCSLDYLCYDVITYRSSMLDFHRKLIDNITSENLQLTNTFTIK